MSRIPAADNFMVSLGHEAYRVGGSVRDGIIGKREKDADYVVRGVPMFDLGRSLVEAGAKISPIKDRTLTQIGWRALVPKAGMIEVVLPRTEQNAGAGRAQIITVDPSLSLVEDAKRRDFTFNALYLPIGRDAPLDPTGTGVYDLQHRIIRTTHADSFRDDPLRTMRALRFVSTMNADLAEETEAQMTAHADRVDGLTVDGHTSGTLLDELVKLLMGQCPAKALRITRDTGVMAVALPELAPMLGFEQGSRYHDMTTDEHTFTALETAAHVDAPLRVRLALLFHDSGKPESAWVGKDSRKHYYAKEHSMVYMGVEKSYTSEDHEVVGERIWREAADRLHADRKLREEVATLIREHMVPCVKVNPVKVRRARVRLGDEMLRDLYLMRMCDLSGKGSKNLKFLKNISDMEVVRNQAAADGVPTSTKELQITGRDAHEAGLIGRDIGEALRAVLDEVVVRADELALSREWQLTRLEAAA